jgi:hypothetical protein
MEHLTRGLVNSNGSSVFKGLTALLKGKAYTPYLMGRFSTLEEDEEKLAQFTYVISKLDKVRLILELLRLTMDEKPIGEFSYIGQEELINTMSFLVDMILYPEASIEELYNKFVFGMKDFGWSLGDELDIENKIHPGLILFKDLPYSVRASYLTFEAIVRILLEMK